MKRPKLKYWCEKRKAKLLTKRTCIASREAKNGLTWRASMRVCLTCEGPELLAHTKGDEDETITTSNDK